MAWLDEMVLAANEERDMKKDPRARFLPLVILPAIMPAMLMPVVLNHHVSDGLLGGAMGVPIGLAIGGLVWMKKGGRRCSTDS